MAAGLACLHVASPMRADSLEVWKTHRQTSLTGQKVAATFKSSPRLLTMSRIYKHFVFPGRFQDFSRTEQVMISAYT